MKTDIKTTLKERVMTYIREKISDGIYQTGERIETIRQLEKELNVSHVVAASAIRELAETGILKTKVGCGTFVAEGIGKISSGKRSRKNLYFFFLPKEDGKVSLYHTEILSALQALARKEDWRVEIRTLNEESLKLAGDDPDAVGVIHVSTENELPGIAIPVVTYGMAPREPEKCCVSPDNYKTAFLAAKRLDELGYQNLVYVTAEDKGGDMYPQDHFTELRRGVEDYCKRHAVHCAKMLTWHIYKRKHEVADFLRKDKIPPKTALVIGNRGMAAEIREEAEHAGLRIPDDLGIVAFIKRGGLENYSPIDTYHFNSREIAENCFAAIRIARNGGTLPSRILVNMTLSEENSVRSFYE